MSKLSSFLVAGFTALAALAGPALADDAADIAALDAEWVALVAAQDAEAIAMIYAADGAVLAPNGPIAVGREAVAGFWSSIFAIPGVSMSFAPTEIGVSASGDMAYDIGTYALSFDGADGRVEDTGKYVVTWIKEDGAWKVKADIFNTDLPAQ